MTLTKTATSRGSFRGRELTADQYRLPPGMQGHMLINTRDKDGWQLDGAFDTFNYWQLEKYSVAGAEKRDHTEGGRTNQLTEMLRFGRIAERLQN